MALFPDLPLFEEIYNVSRSNDYVNYSLDQFNRTWEDILEEGTMDSSTSAYGDMFTNDVNIAAAETSDVWDLFSDPSSDMDTSEEPQTVSAANNKCDECEQSHQNVTKDTEGEEIHCETSSYVLRRRNRRISNDMVKGKALFRSSLRKNKKLKLYEMKKFRDPTRERERINAINSKLNRERRKREMCQMEDEITDLKAKNTSYQEEILSIKEKLRSAKAAIRLLKKQMNLNNSK